MTTEPPSWDDIPFPGDDDPQAPTVAAPFAPTGRAGPTPPHSIEAERECLAAPVVDAKALERLVKTGLTPADFYSERHRLIFAAMLVMRERQTPIDPVLLQQALIDAGVYERVGGARAIGELLDRAGTVTNLEHYAAVVRRKAAARALIDAARSIEVAGHQGADDELDAYMAQSAEALRQATDRFRPRQSLRLGDWVACRRFSGKAPPVNWLVPDVIARGESHVIAAPGESGKGFLTLNLALQLASGIYHTGRRAPFGKAILPLAPPCACVLLYAEDTEDALHQRLDALDPDHVMRDRAGERLVAVPMPSAGGAMNILERGPTGALSSTEAWRDMLDQLAQVPDLGLVLIDPLSCFLSLDIDSESTVAQAIAGEITRAASQLQAAFLLAHHMRKGDEARHPNAQPLPNHEGVKASIRGVAALLNGVRMGYGLMPLPSQYAKAVLTKLGERGELDVAKVYWGAIVKANGKVDRRPRLYVRAEYGLLEDRTADVAAMGRLDDVLKALVTPGSGKASA